MSIFPATDLVMDVARAADPRKRDAAVRRLNEMSGASAAPAEFSRLVEAAPLAHEPSLASPPSPFARVEPKRPPAVEAALKFESFVMQSWLEILLPKEESGAFGSSAGAGVWRSMMAEQLGAQLARANALGLHKTFAVHEQGRVQKTEGKIVG